MKFANSFTHTYVKVLSQNKSIIIPQDVSKPSSGKQSKFEIE